MSDGLSAEFCSCFGMFIAFSDGLLSGLTSVGLFSIKNLSSFDNHSNDTTI